MIAKGILREWTLFRDISIYKTQTKNMPAYILFQICVINGFINLT